VQVYDIEEKDPNPPPPSEEDPGEAPPPIIIQVPELAVLKHRIDSINDNTGVTPVVSVDDGDASCMSCSGCHAAASQPSCLQIRNLSTMLRIRPVLGIDACQASHHAQLASPSGTPDLTMI